MCLSVLVFSQSATLTQRRIFHFFHLLLNTQIFSGRDEGSFVLDATDHRQMAEWHSECSWCPPSTLLLVDKKTEIDLWAFPSKSRVDAVPAPGSNRGLWLASRQTDTAPQSSVIEMRGHDQTGRNSVIVNSLFSGWLTLTQSSQLGEFRNTFCWARFLFCS